MLNLLSLVFKVDSKVAFLMALLRLLMVCLSESVCVCVPFDGEVTCTGCIPTLDLYGGCASRETLIK